MLLFIMEAFIAFITLEQNNDSQKSEKITHVVRCSALLTCVA